MIKKYNDFLNEKLSDKLFGKNEEEIMDFLKSLTDPQTILNKAINLNFIRGIKYAIDNGAELKNFQIKRYIDDNNFEIVKYMIEHTERIEYYDDIFKLLVERKNIELLKSMFENGFKIKGNAIINVELVIRNSDIEIVDFLLKYVDLDKFGELLMIKALIISNINMINLLINKGIDINMNKYNPIVYACYNKKFKKIINFLIENNLNLNEYLNDALKTIVNRGLIEQVKYLIELGADVNIISDEYQINSENMKELIEKIKNAK